MTARVLAFQLGDDPAPDMLCTRDQRLELALAGSVLPASRRRVPHHTLAGIPKSSKESKIGIHPRVSFLYL